MKNILIAILFSSCAASGQTAYDRKQDLKLTSYQVALTNLQAQTTALINKVTTLENQIGVLQSSLANVFKRLNDIEHENALKDTVVFSSKFNVVPVSNTKTKIDLK